MTRSLIFRSTPSHLSSHPDRGPQTPARANAQATGHVRPGQRQAPLLVVIVSALALGTAVLLWSAAAQAQTAPPAPAVASAPSNEPHYTAAQIAQAFSFIDANRDGQLSREEAAGFRGVARHFDEADTNKDGMLSREEFESALSGGKKR